MTGHEEYRALAPQRLQQLREMLRVSSIVRVDEICRDLNVSPATARRDLDLLEKAGELRRVHGGAVSVNTVISEPLFDDKTEIAAAQKKAIAAEAVKLLKPNETVYLDGGSTVLRLAGMLRSMTRLTIVTNSLRTAMELSGAGPNLILIGGDFRRLSQTMVGPLTRLMLSELHVDKAIMGTIGMDIQHGLTTTDPAEAYTKQLVMQRARDVILLADATKAGIVSFAHAGDFSDIHTLITDASIGKPFLKAIKKHGVRVITTDV